MAKLELLNWILSNTWSTFHRVIGPFCAALCQVSLLGSRHKPGGARQRQDCGGRTCILRDREKALYHPGRAGPQKLRPQHDRRGLTSRPGGAGESAGLNGWTSQLTQTAASPKKKRKKERRLGLFCVLRCNAWHPTLEGAVWIERNQKVWSSIACVGACQIWRQSMNETRKHHCFAFVGVLLHISIFDG